MAAVVEIKPKRDWLIDEQGLTSPPTQYRLLRASGDGFYRSEDQPTVSKYWKNTKSKHNDQLFIY